MSDSEKEKQVIKGYVIEDVPDTPFYAMRNRQSVDDSWPDPAQQPVSVSEVTVKDGFIIFSCTCGKRVKIPVSYAGSKGKCPNCGKLINIPKLSI